VTSSTYLLNDLADLPTDRRHWSKRTRPIARGLISVRVALPLAFCGCAFGVLCGLLLSALFGALLVGYLAVTMAYSLGLKRVPLFDAFIIALLFTARIAMGMAINEHGASDWLLAFSVAFFFSLALAKRHTEIQRAIGSDQMFTITARGYRADDVPLTLVCGLGAGLMAVQMLIMYITEEVFAAVGYSNSAWLRLIPPLLAIWIGRVWLLAHRGEMADDPVLFALRDWPSLILGAAVMLAFLVSI
jgi:4-hydroxybenzoate polyprenyltransferase